MSGGSLINFHLEDADDLNTFCKTWKNMRQNLR